MTNQDRTSTCESCGTPFILTSSEATSGAAAPSLCPACRLLLPEDGRRRGLVKFFNLRKGWGFLTQTDGQEIFFHRSALGDSAEPPLQEGELVEYGVEETARGPQAVEMKRLEIAAS